MVSLPGSTVTERAAPAKGLEDAPWEVAALPWLRRFVGLRFIGLIAIVGLLLAAVSEGGIESPTPLFMVILAYAVLNLLLFVGSRRMDEQRSRAATLLLEFSLIADFLLILALAHFSAGTGGPLTLFLLVPLLGAVLAVPERRAMLLTALASAGLLISLGIDPASAPAGPLASREVVTSLVLVLLWALVLALLWYRRRGRFLEERLSLLEAERLQLMGEVRAAAANGEGRNLAAAATWRERGGSVESVASALASDLREPTGVVRARAENVRFHLRERSDLQGLVPDLDRVLRAVDRLDDTRLTLAALARLESSDPVSTSVSQVAAEVRKALVREYERDGLRLRIEAPSRLPQVAASHNEVRLVLVRLLDSSRRSARASRRSSRILARFLQEGGNLALIVDDPFPVPGEEDSWFDPSFSPKERPAMGLALAVARAVAERRGGGVTAERGQKGGLSVKVLLRFAGTDREDRMPGSLELDASSITPAKDTVR
ncbi:MAG: hypothetical protein V2A76_09680 [Planctomycetota bacterium]